MKRKSEDAVLEYFQDAPIAAAEVMLYLVTKVVNRRKPQTEMVGKRGPGRPKMSPEARKKISDAQKKRWVKQAEEPTSPSNAAD